MHVGGLSTTRADIVHFLTLFKHASLLGKWAVTFSSYLPFPCGLKPLSGSFWHHRSYATHFPSQCVLLPWQLHKHGNVLENLPSLILELFFLQQWIPEQHCQTLFSNSFFLLLFQTQHWTYKAFQTSCGRFVSYILSSSHVTTFIAGEGASVYTLLVSENNLSCQLRVSINWRSAQWWWWLWWWILQNKRSTLIAAKVCHLFYL